MVRKGSLSNPVDCCVVFERSLGLDEFTMFYVHNFLSSLGGYRQRPGNLRSPSQASIGAFL